MDSNGLSDPIATVRVASEKRATRVIRKTLEPIWDQRFEIPSDASQDVLDTVQVRVDDWDMLSSNDFIGKAVIALHKYTDKKAKRSWHPLLDAKGVRPSEPLGEVEVEIRWLYSPDHDHFAEDANFERKRPNCLKVRVCQATNLRASDINGKSDPFCTLELGAHTRTTKVQRATLCPSWNEEFSILCESKALYLRILVEDWDLMDSNDFLGRYVAPIESWYDKRRRREWFTLAREDGKQDAVQRGQRLRHGSKFSSTW